MPATMRKHMPAREFRDFRRALPTALFLFLATVITPVCATAAERLAGYAPVDLTSWQPRTAASAMALIEPLYRAHPESDEGRPTLRLNLRSDGEGGLVIELEMRGYLDDSVAGEDYLAFVSSNANGWRLDALGRRNICARGENAGQPTTKPCP